MNDDRDLDRLLHDEGARWRSAVKVDLDVEAVPVRERSERHRVGQLAAAVGSVGVIAAALAVMIGPRFAAVGPSASQIASTQPLGTQAPVGTSPPLDSPWPAVDTDGDARACWGLLDTRSGELDLRRVAYDLGTATAAIHQSDLPSVFADQLREARGYRATAAG